MKRVKLTVEFFTTVPENTDVESLYVNVPGQHLQVLKLCGSKEVLVSKTEDYKNVTSEELNETVDTDG